MNFTPGGVARLHQPSAACVPPGLSPEVAHRVGCAVQVGLEDDHHNRYQSTCPVCRDNVGYVFYESTSTGVLQEENGLVRKMNRGGTPTGHRVAQFPRRRRQRFECCLNKTELRRDYVTTLCRQRRNQPGAVRRQAE